MTDHIKPFDGVVQYITIYSLPSLFDKLTL